MIYIFYGNDEYSAKNYLREVVGNWSLPRVEYFEGDDLPDVLNMGSMDLFSTEQVFVFYNLFNKVVNEKNLEVLVAQKNKLVFVENSLDKRLSFIKSVLKHKGIETREFSAPEGAGLSSWVKAKAKEYGVEITHQNADILLLRLGVDTLSRGQSFFASKSVSLRQLDNELKKLADFSEGGEITLEAIEKLVTEDIETQGFDIINALADKDKDKLFMLCERFFSTGGDSDKAKFILLTNMLGEQFRNILLVKDVSASGMSEEQILEKTGWKSGRLFVLKKIAARFERKVVLETLSKLESLDLELKTSSTPAHVILDLILIQAA